MLFRTSRKFWTKIWQKFFSRVDFSLSSTQLTAERMHKSALKFFLFPLNPRNWFWYQNDPKDLNFLNRLKFCWSDVRVTSYRPPERPLLVKELKSTFLAYVKGLTTKLVLALTNIINESWLSHTWRHRYQKWRHYGHTGPETGSN